LSKLQRKPGAGDPESKEKDRLSRTIIPVPIVGFPTGRRITDKHIIRRTMTAVKLEDARRVISAAEKKASEIGQSMNIAVADEGGNIVAHIRWTTGGLAALISP
jgi:Haem-degrading